MKAASLALFITPLWDVPDEVGHYALIQDLADGRGLPLPGRSLIPENVLTDWRGPKSASGPVLNWIAQHPPLYHVLATPFLIAARGITSDLRWQFRAPRLLSAICGSVALLIFFRVFREAGADEPLAFAAAVGIGFVPMYTHLSSGTNHDVMLALAAGFAALYWVRSQKTSLLTDGLRMSLALSLMGLIKFSALAVALPLVVLSWRTLGGSQRGALFRWLGVAALSVSLPALWTLRQFVLLGNVRVHPISKERFAIHGFLRYLRDNPVVDHSFKNFFGLIGWTGTGNGNVRWFQISGLYLVPFLVLGLVTAFGAAFWLTRKADGLGRSLSLAAAAATFCVCFLWIFAASDGSALPKRLLYSLVASVPLLAVGQAFSKPGFRDPHSGSQVVFICFSLAYLVNSWEAYSIYGQMRATHGRYFFAVLPFMVMGFLLPTGALVRQYPRRYLLLFGTVLALGVNEVAFFLLRVLPFYRSGAHAPHVA